jgi:RNA polymerase sigma-70 factor (ECF subfamily)
VAAVADRMPTPATDAILVASLASSPPRTGHLARTDRATSTEQEQSAVSLAERIRQGDRAAEQTLVEQYSRSLRLLLRHATPDPQLAEDVYQEAFAVLIKRLRGDGLEDPTKVSAFLQATARLLLLNHERKGARRATMANTELVERTAGADSDPDRAIAREEARVLVHRAIRGLVPRDRDILVRFYLRDEDRDRICAVHRISHKHFYRVLCRARQRLRAEIEAESDDAADGDDGRPDGCD